MLNNTEDDLFWSLNERQIVQPTNIVDNINGGLKKAKLKIKKKPKIIMCVISVAILISLLIFAIVMGSRTTYTSETEMRTALQGTYTYYNDNGVALRQVVISGNTMQYIYKYGGHYPLLDSTIDWNPSKGTFETFETWVVLNNGNIKNDGDTYKKGGYMSTQSSSNNTYESATSVLKFTNINVTSNSSYTVCTGTITNKGNKTYHYVEIKGSFKDSSGNVLDTDWTYAVGSEGLAPGESSTFRMSVPKNHSITSCSVKILNYD